MTMELREFRSGLKRPIAKMAMLLKPSRNRGKSHEKMIRKLGTSRRRRGAGSPDQVDLETP